MAELVFSMYAYQELRDQLGNLDEFRFVFTSQAFTKQRARKEKQFARKNAMFEEAKKLKVRIRLSRKADRWKSCI